MSIASIFVNLFYIYLLIGLVFAIWFVNRGAAKIDQGVKEANWKLRLLLLPGSAALWPILLRKVLNSGKKQSDL